MSTLGRLLLFSGRSLLLPRTSSPLFFRPLSTTHLVHREARYIVGKGKGPSPSQLRGKTIDESDNETVNLDALARQETTVAEEEADWSPFPDGDTLEKLYGGVRFKDLPFVTVICAPNNTKFWANDGQGNRLEYCSPRKYGFLNASKRSNVAAQVTGMNLGQLLRNRSVTAVRVRVDGFNNGRIAAVKGLVQAGINVVSVTDITVVDWHASQRPKKKKRRN